ncbi:hypothetical protein CSUNSWCD_2034 [Campylobacter showae CSUNSWCD]|uniref:Uncharacterized protein n=1 Tax=Campylobacter showae CSUNSWCD TaxID=1244083 RepID=M5IRY4_9BACT|nr:hypothetical protein CSUNSWCD_2034 [Campylobacter showae CSUNSWCD]
MICHLTSSIIYGKFLKFAEKSTLENYAGTLAVNQNRSKRVQAIKIKSYHQI